MVEEIINEYKKKSPKELQKLKENIEKQLELLVANKGKKKAFTKLQEDAKKNNITIKNKDKTILRDMDFYSFFYEFKKLSQNVQTTNDLSLSFNGYKEIINLEEQLKQINNHFVVWDVAGPDYKELANEIASLDKLLVIQENREFQKEEAFLAVNKLVFIGKDLEISDLYNLSVQITNQEEIESHLTKINKLKNKILAKESKATKKSGISNKALKKLSVEQLLMLRSEVNKTYTDLSQSNKPDQTANNNALVSRFKAALVVIDGKISKKWPEYKERGELYFEALNMLIATIPKKDRKSKRNDKEYIEKLSKEIGEYFNKKPSMEGLKTLAPLYAKLTLKQQEKFNTNLETIKKIQDLYDKQVLASINDINHLEHYASQENKDNTKAKKKTPSILGSADDNELDFTVDQKQASSRLDKYEAEGDKIPRTEENESAIDKFNAIVNEDIKNQDTVQLPGFDNYRGSFSSDVDSVSTIGEAESLEKVIGGNAERQVLPHITPTLGNDDSVSRVKKDNDGLGKVAKTDSQGKLTSSNEESRSKNDKLLSQKPITEEQREIWKREVLKKNNSSKKQAIGESVEALSSIMGASVKKKAQGKSDDNLKQVSKKVVEDPKAATKQNKVRPSRARGIIRFFIGIGGIKNPSRNSENTQLKDTSPTGKTKKNAHLDKHLLAYAREVILNPNTDQVDYSKFAEATTGKKNTPLRQPDEGNAKVRNPSLSLGK